MRRILASDIVVPRVTGSSATDFAQWQDKSKAPLKNLVESVILQDQIIVPIADFTTLWLLLDAFGERGVMALLDSDALRFCRYTGMLTYIRRGPDPARFGLYFMTGSPPPGQAYRDELAIYSPLDTAIDLALAAMPSAPTNRKFRETVLARTLEFDAFANEELIRNATYKDIIRHGILELPLSEFSSVPRHIAEGQRGASEDMESTWRQDKTAALFALANFNLHLAIFRATDCTDNATRLPTADLVYAKFKDKLDGTSKRDSFDVLRVLADVPDLGQLVLQRVITIEDIVKLRESKDAIAFRSWFHENCDKDTLSVSKAYIDMVQQVSRMSSAPARVIRFLVTNALGLVLGNVAGFAMDAIEEFLLDRIVRAPSAKFFINELKQLGDHAM